MLNKRWVDTGSNYFYVNEDDLVVCEVYSRPYHTGSDLTFIFGTSEDHERFLSLEAAKAFAEKHY